ncbi:MAG: alpha/beta fold hydrolase [Isosphaeraceae bacterium]|nr:alpha/beta fold hydrolase [Isosphaeraceae bacterium]
MSSSASSTLSLALDAPIVLAHGLLGFGRIGLGRLTLAEYFRDIPRYLESLGNRVLVTNVPAVAGIATRAEALREQILEAFPGEPVHIVGHSMGGLDARALLARGDSSIRIASLTTIATPHLGSPLADLVKMHAGRLSAWLTRMGLDHRGILDVTRPAARAFHHRCAAPSGVACFSAAGAPERSQVCKVLRRFHELLEGLEGPNDGLVSAASATAFGTPLPAWPLDHFRQMNWLTPTGPDELDPTIAGCYRSVLANLAEHGFARRDRPPGFGRLPARLSSGPFEPMRI